MEETSWRPISTAKPPELCDLLCKAHICRNRDASSWAALEDRHFYKLRQMDSHCSAGATMRPLRNEPAKVQKTADGGSYDSTMTSFEAELAANEVPERELDWTEDALTESEPLWRWLKQQLDESTNVDACHEAASLLITNHAAVLRDVTNPVPMSQMDIPRVRMEHTKYADQALREVARRLLGLRHEQATLIASDSEQLGAWAQAAKCLDARIQSTPRERPGRTPDMSVGAAGEMRAAVQQLWWLTWSTARMLQAQAGPSRPPALSPRSYARRLTQLDGLTPPRKTL